MGNQVHHCSPPVPGRIKAKMPSNMFKVKNINEQGEVIWRGVIEVNSVDLVLHQKVGNPVRWPLKSLRRYGFDKGLFSFESGRSCATGPGIYAFKCKNAEQLFNMVKTNTNQASADVPSTSNSAPNLGNAQQRNHPVPAHMPMPHNHTSSMSRLISTNGRIAGRVTSGGATSPVPTTPNGGSSPRIRPDLSPAIEYMNAADIQETTTATSHELLSQHTRRSPVPPVKNGTAPPKEPAKKASLNYARLKLGQDEDDAVNVADGSLNVVTAQADRAECLRTETVALVEPTLSEEKTEEQASSPTSLKDENDNRMVTAHTVSSKSIVLKEAKERPPRVKTGLLVEIGSEVDGLMPAARSPVAETYMNLDQSPKVFRPSGSRVQGSVYVVRAKEVAGATPTSPSSYYTNLDTTDELPPRSAPPSCGRDTPGCGDMTGGTLEFSFSTREGNHHGNAVGSSADSVDAVYMNNVKVEGGPAASNSKGKLNYIQVAFEDGSVSTPPQRSLSSSSSGGTPPQTPSSPSRNSGGGSPAKVSQSYAVIDTNKTVALANSQRQISKDGDIATRRTRHDAPVQNR